MGCFPCFDGKPKKPVKRDENITSSRDGQSPAANPVVAPVPTGPTGKHIHVAHLPAPEMHVGAKPTAGASGGMPMWWFLGANNR